MTFSPLHFLSLLVLHLFVCNGGFWRQAALTAKAIANYRDVFRLCIIAYPRCAIFRASFRNTFSENEMKWCGLRVCHGHCEEKSMFKNKKNFLRSKLSGRPARLELFF